MTTDTLSSLFSRTDLAGHLSWSEVRSAVNRVSPHFFAEDTMRAFNSKLVGEPAFIEVDGNTVVGFITSERDSSPTDIAAWNGQRRYTIRTFDGVKVRSSPTHGYGAFASRIEALAAFRTLKTL